MKKLLCAALAAAMLAGCSAPGAQTTPPETVMEDSGTVRIRLGDGSLTVTAPDGMAENAVTTGHDIIYYEEGHDETYGEGEAGDAHSAEEAARHTVIHINAPGTYVLSGKLDLGQIAVDLGEDAKNDPDAVVTLVLNNLDITCTVAPAIIFYNVYECGDAGNPSAVVDTSAAGANVVLAEGSQNYVNGSHVAKIYKPGTEKKLHKYDAAFYSKMTMNVGGEGSLSITADNEGLDSELHLTINSGDISIRSGNDGINTNEDGVSVTTINGGTVSIVVTGETGEGDGIDSNGSLVINGGTVMAYACATSGDSGIDADTGIYLNGGTVIATGNMLDRIDERSQTHAVFSFSQSQMPGTYTLKTADGQTVLEVQAPNSFTNLILSAPTLTEGTYTLWFGDTRFEGMLGGGRFGMMEPIDRPELPDRGDGYVEIPPQPTQPIVTQGTVQPPPQGDRPADMPVAQFPQGSEGQMPVPPMPEEGGGNMPMPQLPEGVEPPRDGNRPITVIPADGVMSDEFPIQPGANYFYMVRAAQ